MKKLKRVVIKEELVALTGDFRPALILNQFIYWSERMFDTDKYIREEKERALKSDMDVKISESKGWIYKKAEELNDELMIGMSNPTIRKYIGQLVKSGYLHERKNPAHSWDKTMQYRVDLFKVQYDLGKLGMSLEGYSLLPNVTIEDIEDTKNDNKKDSSAPTEEPNNNDSRESHKNVFDSNSISQNTDIIQEKNKKNNNLDLIKDSGVKITSKITSKLFECMDKWDTVLLIKCIEYMYHNCTEDKFNLNYLIKIYNNPNFLNGTNDSIKSNLNPKIHNFQGSDNFLKYSEEELEDMLKHNRHEKSKR